MSRNLRNFTNVFETYLSDYIKGVAVNLGDGIDHSDFALPTFPFAFDIDAPEIPESKLSIRFDDMELFLELNMILAFGATYEINLYSTTTPIGIRIGQLLHLGLSPQWILYCQSRVKATLTSAVASTSSSTTGPPSTLHYSVTRYQTWFCEYI
jgi:hypothetical protein